MAIRISVNPAIQKLGLFICLVIIISFFTSVLVQVGRERENNLCVTEKANINSTCCWDWRLGAVQQTFKCPFTLLFSAMFCFGTSFICFFVSGLTKCLCPEIVYATYRTLCCRVFSQYYILVLHIFGCMFALVFIFTLLIVSITKDSCFYGADMLKNCAHNREYCWMIVLICLGFLVCLFATMISVYESRRFYVERLDDSMCDRLYDEYLVPEDIHDYLKTLP